MCQVFCLAVVGALVAALALLPVAAEGGQIWFGGVDPVVAADRERVGNDPPGAYAGLDFMDLFRPNAPWTRTASIIQVFKVSTQFFGRASDQMLMRMFKDLKRRHIALGMDALMLSGDGECGAGVEGYSAPGRCSRSLIASRSSEGR